MVRRHERLLGQGSAGLLLLLAVWIGRGKSAVMLLLVVVMVVGGERQAALLELLRGGGGGGEEGRVGRIARLPATSSSSEQFQQGGCRKFLAAPTLGEIVGMAVQQRRGQASQTAAKLAAGPQADVVGREGETRMERPVGEAVQAAGGRGRLGAVTKQIQTLLRAAAALVVEPLSCNTENRQNIKIYHPKSLERSFKY